MKIFYIKLSIVFFVTIHSVAAQNVAALDAKYGFRNYKFGISASAVSNLIKLKPSAYENKKIATYRKKDEKLAVGVYKLTNITYQFYKDKLMLVTLETGVADGANILELLQNLYGKPTQVLKAGQSYSFNSYEWFGSRVELSYVETVRDKTVYIKYMAKPVYDEMFRDEKEEENAAKRKQNLQKQAALKDL